MKISFLQGDITKVADQFDAIVNAANSSLLGGGGVDGAIHYAAGRELLQECRTLGGCETGKAKSTKAYRLPCQYVIHAVGPDYKWEGEEKARKLLFSAYLHAMNEAKRLGIKKVAFFDTICPGNNMEFTWVLFSQRDYDVYVKAYSIKEEEKENEIPQHN